jgi:CRISPR/Cas system CSM-associated protein Csm3 (group 7 of RAMP superfamily)
MADPIANKRNADDKRLERPVLHLARCVLEAVTPLSLSTGNPDGVFDTALVTDANDLPAIPGSSLAGVLRHLWRTSYGAETHDDTLFGFQEQNVGDASRLSVSWGVLLDGEGRAAEGLLPVEDAARVQDDQLFQRALSQLDEPVFRNRVSLSHRGAAADAGKFDRAVLPRGNRFAVELRLWSDVKDDPDWERLLNLLAHPGLRVGGATRAGLGKLGCVACHRGSFNLADDADVESFRGLDRAMHATDDLTPYTPAMTTEDVITGKLRLTPRGFWRIGQGDTDLRGGSNGYQGKPADLLPVSDEVIEWDQEGKPQVIEYRLLFPAASLKGALAHRMSFHANRFAGVWAQVFDEEPSRPARLEAFLGSSKDKGEDAGQAGALLIDDAFIPLAPDDLKEVPHNSIDRFTGGVRNRVLYSELSVYKTRKPIEIDIALDLDRLTRNKADVAAVRRALKAALDDLCQGRLALGSRTTIGNGFFEGHIDGDLKAWLDDEEDGATQNTNEEAA